MNSKKAKNKQCINLRISKVLDKINQITMEKNITHFALFRSNKSFCTTATTSHSTESEGIPTWLEWVAGIILFIILIKACN